MCKHMVVNNNAVKMLLGHFINTSYVFRLVLITAQTDRPPLKVHLRSVLCVLDFKLVAFGHFLQQKQKRKSKNGNSKS